MGEQGTGILLIDDERIDRDTMCRILTAEGFQVWAGANADDARIILEQHRDEVDLLITDVSLPGRSGVELASSLLKQKADLKLLFVSGYVGAEVIRFYGMSASDLHFLRKPFKSDALIGRVRDVLKSDEPMQWSLQPDGEEKPEAPKGK